MLKTIVTPVLIALSLGASNPVLADDNPGAGASVGDSCQTNRDCDKSEGQHCVKNACAVPGKGGGGKNGGKKPPEDNDEDDGGGSTGGGAGSKCSLPAGFTLKCRLNSGRVVDACGYAGAIPARIGAPCQIGYEYGIAIK